VPSNAELRWPHARRGCLNIRRGRADRSDRSMDVIEALLPIPILAGGLVRWL